MSTPQTPHKQNQSKAKPPVKDLPASSKKRQRFRRVAVVISVLASIILLIIAIGLGLYDQFLSRFENKVYPGVAVADVVVSGLTYSEALEAVDSKVDQLYQSGILIEFSGAGAVTEETNSSLVLLPEIVPLSFSGTVQTFYSTQSEAAIDKAFAIGRTGSQREQSLAQFNAWRSGRNIMLDETINRQIIEDLIVENFSSFESPSQNASLFITTDGSVEIVPEQSGMEFDVTSIVDQVVEQIQNLDSTSIVISLQSISPEVTAADVTNDLDVINDLLSRAPVTITWEDKTWTYDRAEVGSWLNYSTQGQLSIDANILEDSLSKPAAEVVVSPQEGRWQVDKDAGGSVVGLTQFSEAQEGRTIDYLATSVAIMEYLQGVSDDVVLSVVVEEPKFSQENANDLGIKDILGTGHSNMAGSPYNRRQNISRGIELLNGLLIAPNEEFSLVDALQPFTLENGYVAELVIKGNETTPEVGGGLCQIGTTTFRGAMFSGLDITARQNHSYAVSYYADDRNGLPGTDATIYEGWPDLRFINDTPGYILLQTRLEGNDLYFDYWGTDDGRIADFTPPTISGWVSPPPTKEVETTELAPGERRCTESAHAGTSAAFDYTIQYLDGTSHQETFTSTYKPWQAVCLVGVDPAAALEEADTVDDPVEDTTSPETEDPADTTGDVQPKKKKNAAKTTGE